MSARFDSLYDAIAQLSATESSETTQNGSFASTIESAIEFLSEVLFRGPVRFLSHVFFGGDVTVEGQLTFPDNMAGSAVISKYTQSVDIVFDHPFSTTPVVTISQVITTATDSAFLSEGFNAGVTNVSPSGFTISLDALALRNYSYNWIAVAVSNAHQTVSSSPLMDILGLEDQLNASQSGSLESTGSGIPNESTPSGWLDTQ